MASSYTKFHCKNCFLRLEICTTFEDISSISQPEASFMNCITSKDNGVSIAPYASFYFMTYIFSSLGLVSTDHIART